MKFRFRIIEEAAITNKLEILDDAKFFALLDKTTTDNKFVDRAQFEKLKGGNDGFYCLLDDKGNLLAAICMRKNKLGLNDLYINEIQSFVKGAGRELLNKVFSTYDNLWLMAEPGNGKLVSYYSSFGLDKFMLPKAESIYETDTYYFTNIKDLKSFEEKIRQKYRRV